MVYLVLQCGILSQYAPGVMDRTIRVRQTARVSARLPLQLTPTDGAVAVVECDRVG